MADWRRVGSKARERWSTGPLRISRLPHNSRSPSAMRPFSRRGLSRDEAAIYIGVSAAKFDEMVADGRMHWLLRGREVIALADATAAIQTPTGAITIYRRHN